ncbi:MAG: uncharacterized protein QOE90_519 [Thermoplasmata archaeon]|jgi:uncharacterized protein YciI|nr:uncharacterized protein [Thermoplasmata archaeon]
MPSPVYHVVMHAPGPKWQEGTAFGDQPGIRGHVAHWMALLTEGALAHGGPFLDDSGGMMVARLDAEQAEAFAAQDPAVKEGVLTYSIRPWLDAMGSMRVRVTDEDAD